MSVFGNIWGNIWGTGQNVPVTPPGGLGANIDLSGNVTGSSSEVSYSDIQSPVDFRLDLKTGDMHMHPVRGITFVYGQDAVVQAIALKFREIKETWFNDLDLGMHFESVHGKLSAEDLDDAVREELFEIPWIESIEELKVNINNRTATVDFVVTSTLGKLSGRI